MVTLGNFFFKTRNYLFPFFYVVLFIPFPRISEAFAIPFIIGLAVALLGQFVRGLTIGLVYVKRGGKDRRIYAEGLVTDGLFTHCRNPMYVGNVLLIVGMSILSNSVFSVLVMIPLFVFIYQAIIKAEEAYLKKEYGPDFKAYCKSTNRWFPKLKGLFETVQDNDFKLKKVVFKEYGTTFLWTLGSVLLLGYNWYWADSEGFLSYGYPYIIFGAFVLGGLYMIARGLKKSERRKLYAKMRSQTESDV